MNPQMISIDKVVDPFKTGDIVITKSVVPLIQHYAVAFHRNGVTMIGDNSFINKQINVYTLEDYKKTRTILGIVRNEDSLKTTDAQVEKAVQDYIKTGYNFWGNNCESWARIACNCEFGTDQRVKWGIGILLGLIIILIIIK